MAGPFFSGRHRLAGSLSALRVPSLRLYRAAGKHCPLPSGSWGLLAAPATMELIEQLYNASQNASESAR